MSKGMPSLMALLGLVAVAGFQNRDKLRDMIGDARRERDAPDDPGRAPQSGGARSGGLLEEIGQMFGSGDSGRNLSEGLGELVTRIRGSGFGDRADSWVSREANQDLQPNELEQAIGRDTIEDLARKTGLPSAEILRRLSAALPQTVNRLTPDGHLPSEEEAQRFI